jgi:Do/DeqQ family serine protease
MTGQLILSFMRFFMKQTFLPAVFFACLAVFSLPGFAEDSVPRTKVEMAQGFAPVIKRVTPAVVNIYTRMVVRQRIISPFMNDPMFRQFFGDALPYGLTRERVENSLGSGVIVGADGVIVTNNHVIEGADKIVVVLSDRREFEADVIATDKRSDLAVLRLKAKNETFPTLPLMDSDEAEVGDLVLAIGNPFGVGQTVTMGIVSASARTGAGLGGGDTNYFIQTDAAINPGNSGGALVSADGRLMGVPSSIYSKDGGSLGIGFAIPSNLVRTIVAAAENGGKIMRGWTGVSVQNVTVELAQSLGLPRPTGVIVRGIHAQSPAKDLRIGDVITSVNGHAIDDEDGFRFRLTTAPIGTPLTLKVLREKAEKEITVPLIAPPAGTDTPVTLKGRTPLAGAKIAALSPALMEEMNIDGDEGVIVVAVAAKSAAARLGIAKGDIILAINNRPAKTAADVETALREADGWRITLRRDGRTLNVVVR